MSKGNRNILGTIVATLDGMGMGVLATLITGTILRQIYTLLGGQFSILWTIGSFAQVLMAAGVAIGVGKGLGVKNVVLYGMIVTSMMGAGAIRLVDGSIAMAIGDPAGAFVTAVATALVGNLIAGRTKLDIMITPGISLIVGAFVATFIAPVVTQLTTWIGQVIMAATEMHPLMMGMIVAVILGFILVSPLSSSALAIGLGLSGITAGAAVAGTASAMIGFAVASFADNGIGGLLAQGLGSSKIQFGNFVKKPIIYLPVLISSALMGMVSTTVFRMETNSLGAGMGTSGLVGQIQTLYVMGADAWWMIVLVHAVFPAMISYIIWKICYRMNWIRKGDMVLPKG